MIGRHQRELNLNEIECEELNQQQRKALEDLSNFIDCFASNVDDLGYESQQNLSLDDDTPFYYRPYRMSKSEQDIVK